MEWLAYFHGEEPLANQQWELMHGIAMGIILMTDSKPHLTLRWLYTVHVFPQRKK